ncbi:LacI family DNA-binding transcriptional regulator [Alishewanella longhuensis]
MSRKPNLKDVAKVAGVSAITVSRVLTDSNEGVG